MATVHPFPGNRVEIAPPCNVEAEAAFLGAVLIENGALAAAPDLQPADFFAPIHARIFERVRALIDRGQSVTPVTLKPYFEADEGLREQGGLSYLARLTADGQGLLAPRELAEQIRELAERRRLIEGAQVTIAAAQDTAVPLDEIALPVRADAAHGLQALDLAALARVEAKATAFAIERLAPLGEVTLLSGPGSAGKSLLGQQLATAAAAGKPCLGLAVESGPALYVTCEDHAAALHWRQAHLCRALDVDMESLAGRLHLVTLRGALASELGTFAHDGTIRPSTTYGQIDRLISRTGARLVFLDNLSHLFAGNENDRGEVTRFANLLNRLASQHGAAIVLFGHTSKGERSSFSGSTAWANAVRSQVTLAHDPETDLRTLTVSKANYGRKGEALTFKWQDWAFVLEDAAEREAESICRDAIERAFDLLEERWSDGAPLSPAPITRRAGRFAPKILAGKFGGRADAWEDLITGWLESRCLAIEVVDKRSKLKGLQVLRRPMA